MEDAAVNSKESEIQVQENNSEKLQSPLIDNTTEINSSDGPVAESSPWCIVRTFSNGSNINYWQLLGSLLMY